MNCNPIAEKNRRAFQICHPSLSLDAASTTPPSASPQNETAFPLAQEQIDRTDFLYWWGLDCLPALQNVSRIFLLANKGIVIVEPSMERVRAVMATVDLTSLIRQRKVFWALGETCKEQLLAILDRSLCFAAKNPYTFFPSPQWDDDDPRDWLKQEIQSRQKQIQQQLDALKESVPNGTSQQLRLWSFEDLRGIAPYTSIQHTLMRTLFFHLREMGHSVEYVRQTDGEYYPPYYRVLRLAQSRPDAIVLCNQSPSYDTVLGKELARQLRIPTIVWYADDPFFAEHLLERNGVSRREYFLMADYDWFHTLEKQEAHSVRYMPGAATIMRRGYTRSRYSCDVVFVGQVRDLRSFFLQLPAPWRAWAEQVIQEKLRFPRKNIRLVMQQFRMPAEIPTDHEDDLRQKILWEANTRFRLRLIQEAARYDLLLFGNQDWANLLPKETVERFFRGVLHRKRLFDCYRNARVVLNIHSLQSGTCLNVRDFDVAAAGGFLLSDWMPHAEEVFTPGFAHQIPLTENSDQEVFFYRNLKEMHKLIDYFLAHPEERAACIERARNRLRAENTYKHRAQTIDETLRKAVVECSKID